MDQTAPGTPEAVSELQPVSITAYARLLTHTQPICFARGAHEPTSILSFPSCFTPTFHAGVPL
eukprot:6205136-Pleurochrysis_carterae.AAC.5